MNERPEQPRIVALDMGKRRIGVAVSDALGITAQAQPTLIVRSETDALRQIRSVVERYCPAAVVLGLPVSLSGEENPASRAVQAFGKRLSEELNIPVDYYDERLTSRQAERVMHEMNIKPSRNKPAVDSMSAVLILQGYLERQENRMNRAPSDGRD